MVGKEAFVNTAEKGQKPSWQFEGIDFIDTMVSISSNERAVIKVIKDNIKWDQQSNSYNYVVHLPPESVEFDPAADKVMEYNTFMKGFQLLYKRDLVRRVSKCHYMFNPDFFIPSGELSTHFELIWSQSKPYKQSIKDTL